MQFISGSGSDLMKAPLLTTDFTTSEGGTGHVGFVFHKQPVMERAIRDAQGSYSQSQLRIESTVTAIQDNTDHVQVEYTDKNGIKRQIRTSYLVGADGKTGFVRKKFLEPLGVMMERCEGCVEAYGTKLTGKTDHSYRTNYDETWVALNWHILLPTKETHPDFPLWALDYTPEQVYDAFFPVQFRFLCNPKRPSVCGRFGLPQDRLWRFEFVVRSDEDPQQMATETATRRIILPYITHPGSRYNLPEPVQFPLDCIETLRSRPFGFQARSCNKWAINRVIVVGDAAHVFPPFGGQGIASGLRDSMALSWRLAALHRQGNINHDRLIKGWYTERKQQLERSLAATIQNGSYVTEGAFVKAAIRDWSLWAMQLVPSWRREMGKGPRADGLTKYKHSQGLPFSPKLRGGICLPQVYCANLSTGEVKFTDDFIFAAGKDGLFQLLVLANDGHDALQILKMLPQLTELSKGWLKEDEASVLIHDVDAPYVGAIHHSRRIARIASADEFAASVLCTNRPKPLYYDAHRIQEEIGDQTRYVIVRPDKFIYAACVDREELLEATRQLVADLS